jgi:type IV pilus assembly protein PilV
MGKVSNKSKMLNAARGFSLLEALVALVILSVGLLGIAGLQARGLLNNVNANFRTQAVFLADDLADRMRANKRAMTGATKHFDQPTAAYTAGCLTSAGCSVQQMARTDFFLWEQRVSGTLPAGSGEVCIDSTPVDGAPGAPMCDGLGGQYAIKVWWDDDRSGAIDSASNDLSDERYVIAFQPQTW